MKWMLSQLVLPLVAIVPAQTAQASPIPVRASWVKNRLLVVWSPASPVIRPSACRLRIYEGSKALGVPRVDLGIQKCEGPWSSTARRSVLGGLRSPDQWFRSDVLSKDQPLTVRLDATYLDGRTNLPEATWSCVTVPAPLPGPERIEHDWTFARAAIIFVVGLILVFSALLAGSAWIAAVSTYRLLRGDARLQDILGELFEIKGWRGFAVVYLFALFAKICLATRVPTALGLLILESETAQLDRLVQTMANLTMAEWQSERGLLRSGIEAGTARERSPDPDRTI